MLRQICSAAALGAVSLVTACQTSPLAEAPDGWITGRIVDTSGAPLSAQLVIGDQTVATDDQGRFAISPDEDRVYRLEISAGAHYPMRQTFSHAELLQDSDLGDVTLVARKPGRTLFVFGGDAMIGRRFYQPFEGEPVLVSPETRLEDSKSLLREMKPYLERADYASINLETPIFETPPGPAAPKSVTFYSAPETLAALEWAGVDYVALGNNHIYDFLEPGLDVSFQHLRESDLDFSGAGKTDMEALAAHRERLEGVDYDFLSFVGWPAGPPTQTARADKGGAALGYAAQLLLTSATSAAQGGVPILQFHGGLEYVEEPTLAIETRLKQAVDIGAALVVAHHPHVTQGLELYDGKLIAWSLGNFLFDQYFYSAQSAALLYVWMDGEEFHHAESVPLYIKAYHPTPAVGAMRNAINRRMFELSAKRGTVVNRSGGHLIVSKDQRAEAESPTFQVETDCVAGRQRTGRDLLARGDFDSFDLFDAPDRSWLSMDERVDFVADAEEASDLALQVELDAEESLTTGMRKFLRVFPRATPMSLRVELGTSTSVDLDIYLQIRADGQGLSDALENGRKIKLGHASLGPGQTANLDLDFDSPRVRARSIRLLFEFQAGEEAVQITMDDLKLIAWETPLGPYSASGCAS